MWYHPFRAVEPMPPYLRRFLLLTLVLPIACAPPGASGTARGLIHLADHLDRAVHLPSGPPEGRAPASPHRFRFGSSRAGWTVQGPLTLQDSPEGLRIGGPLDEGLLMSPDLDLAWRDLREVVLRIRSSGQVSTRLYWAESKRQFLDFWSRRGSLSFPERLHLFRSTHLEIPPSREFQTFRIPTRQLEPPGWSAGREPRVRQLFLQFPGAGEGVVELDEISLILTADHYAGREFGVEREMLQGIGRESVFFRVPGRLQWKIRIPASPRLETHLAVPDTDGEWDFSIGLNGTDDLFQRRIPGGPQWHPVAVDLPAGPGGVAELTVTVRGPEGIAVMGSPIVATTDPPEPPPRVILYVSDALAARHLSGYGYPRPTSPVLDRLAAGGARFEDCVAASTWTRPSTASLFTGLYPPAHGVVSWSDRLPASAPTLAEVFRRHGFHTISFLTNPHAGVSAGADRGFDTVLETPVVTGPLLDPANRETDRALLSSGTSHAINRLFLPWLSSHSHLPTFIYLHAMDPHFPYEPPPPFDRRFRSDPASSPSTGDGPLDTARNRYDGDVAFNDEQIGRILDRLELLRARESTLFLATADHGEEFGEHGMTGHRNHLHEEVTAVPWILSYPGTVAPGTVVSHRVSSIDIFPTLLDLMGLPIPTGLQGVSQVPALRGDRTPDRPIFSHLVRRVAAEDRMALREEAPVGEIGLWEGPWKFILGDYSPRGETWENLYRLEEDPMERNDLSGENPERTRRFRERATEWYLDQVRRRASLGREDRQILHDEEAERRLRALGYLQ